MIEELMSLKEAAAYLNCTTTKLNDITTGSLIPLKCVIIGKRRGYSKKDLDEWKDKFNSLLEDGKVSRKTFRQCAPYNRKRA